MTSSPRPALPALGPLTFARPASRPQLSQEPSAASGRDSAAARGEGGAARGPGSRAGAGPGRERSPRAMGAARARTRPGGGGGEAGAARAPTFPAFRGAPLAPGAGSLFLNRSCYLGVVFPIVPDQELLARRDWLRGQKRQAPGQSERRLLAGRGGAGAALPAGAASQASQAGRAP